MRDGLNAAEGFEAIHTGKPDVEKNDFEIAARGTFERFFGGLGGFDVITLVAEDRRKRFANAGFVVDDQDVRMSGHEKVVAYKVQQEAEVLQRRDSFGWARSSCRYLGKRRGATPHSFCKSV